MLTDLLVASSVVALSYQLLLLSTYVALFAAGLVDVKRRRATDRLWGDESVARSPLAPSVTVIVPVHNEAASVVESVQGMRRLDYPDLHVVVVNDGSTDDTMAALIAAFDLEPVDRSPLFGELTPVLPEGRVVACWEPRRVTGLRGLLVVDKTNGGKADALNAGLAYSRTRLVCTVDGDSLLEPDAILRAVRPFLDDPEGTTAVGGAVRVVNDCAVRGGRVVDVVAARSWLARAQTVEYFRTFLGARPGLAEVDALLVLSGAFAVFERRALLGRGGFVIGGLAEDMHATVALHATGQAAGDRSGVRFASDALVWTEVPTRWWHVRRQRARWQRGLLEVLVFHRSALLRPSHGRFGMLVLPYYWLFEAIGPVIEVAGYVVVLIALLAGALNGPFVVLFLACSLGAGLLLSTAGLVLAALSRQPPRLGWSRLLLGVLFEGMVLRPALSLVRARAVFAAVAGRTATWGGAARTGFATVDPPLDTTVETAGNGPGNVVVEDQ